MTTHEYRFETPDARKIVMRRMDNWEIRDIANACEHISSKESFLVAKAFWRSHYIMTVEVGSDKVHLVILLFPEKVQDFLHYVKAKGLKTLANAPALEHPFSTIVVYDKNAYSAREETGKTLIKAVELNVQPSILALMGEKH